MSSSHLTNTSLSPASSVSAGQLLGVPEHRLNYFLYKRRLRHRYTSFSIPKKNGGERQIFVPPGHLIYLQRRLSILLAQSYTPKQCAQGFLPKRSIVSNAARHTNKDFVLNFDLLDFFPSIHFGRIKGVLTRPPFSYPEHIATVFAQIATTHDGILPQGGASSPLVSNIICRQLDNLLSEYCRQRHIHYTRYADDITLSSHKPMLATAADISQRDIELTHEIYTIVHNCGFHINPSKTRIRSRRQRQQVTGLIVNKSPNVPRRFLKLLDYRLHLCEEHGIINAQRISQKGQSLENITRGQLAYLKMVRGENDFVYRRLCRRYNRIFSSGPPVIPLTALAPSRITNDVPRTNAWADAFARAREGIVFLEILTGNGDQYSATAFHVGNGVCATAAHNIDTCGAGGTSTLQCWLGDVITPHSSVFHSTMNDVGGILFAASAFKDRLPTQLRLPEVGEEVCAIGFPSIPQRDATLVTHIGVVEALPNTYNHPKRFIQVSFQSGGGLSGGCLLDKNGYVIGIMVENVFMGGLGTNAAPPRPYGQAVPIEYFDELVYSTAHVHNHIHSNASLGGQTATQSAAPASNSTSPPA